MMLLHHAYYAIIFAISDWHHGLAFSLKFCGFKLPGLVAGILVLLMSQIPFNNLWALRFLQMCFVC